MAPRPTLSRRARMWVGGILALDGVVLVVLEVLSALAGGRPHLGAVVPLFLGASWFLAACEEREGIEPRGSEAALVDRQPPPTPWVS